ncbi:MAG: FAD-binding oxidoreductase [Aestuariivirga sp.]|uniref:FAD-binding oxidoreductase n=1 Tax=Aestuariivirga sp. TaxID=2650926 RepID=UPI00301A17B8
MAIPVITLSSGPSFPARPGLSILESAAEAEIVLPYSCKVGRCSSCKCRILKGKTDLISPELSLTEEEKREGWVLSCVRTTGEDISVEVDEFLNLVLPAARTLPCRISALTRVAPDVLKVTLRLPHSTEFNFIPGQYIEVIGNNGIRRSYSLATAQISENCFDLHIRHVEGGAMSTYLFRDAKPNDLLRLNGPLGTFFVRQTAAIDLVFLATGTGIAPIKAMLEWISTLPEPESPKSVTVLWGVRHKEDFYLDLKPVCSAFKYILVCSGADEIWDGARGHVQDVFLSMQPDLRNVSVYACGSMEMIQDARRELISNGLASNRFYSDAFVCSSKI